MTQTETGVTFVTGNRNGISPMDPNLTEERSGDVKIRVLNKMGSIGDSKQNLIYYFTAREK